MIKTYRYRLYPNKSQTSTLLQWMDEARHIWNYLRWVYENRNNDAVESPKASEGQTLAQLIDSSMRQMIRDREYTIPDRASSYVKKRLMDTYQDAYKKKRGFPKYKDESHPVDSLTFYFQRDVKLSNVDAVYSKSGDKHDRKRGSILTVDNQPHWVRCKVTKLAGTIRVRHHREFPEVGVIGMANIASANGRWHLNLSVDDFRLGKHSETPAYQEGMNCVGIDIGLHHAFTLSDDSLDSPFIEPEHHYQSKLRELRVLQRKLDRQRRANNPDCFDEKGRSIKGKRPMNKSNQMLKTDKAIKRLHFHVAEKRREWLHALTKWLVDTYDLIAIEDLSPKFMIKNGRLALKALDISFHMFKTMLEYKCRESGTILVKVPAQYTSQTCINCGCVDSANRKSQSKFECVRCGYQNNADILGSKNILAKALLSYT